MGEAERNAALVSANSTLKSALIRARQQFLHLEMTMQSLNTNLSAALNLPASEPGAQNLDPQIDAFVHGDSETFMSPPASHTFQGSSDLHTASPMTLGQSDTSNQNGQASSPNQTQNEPFDSCNYIPYDVAMSPSSETNALEPPSEPQPSKDISQLGKLNYCPDDPASLHALPCGKSAHFLSL
jgi:hypothetical protein